MLSRSVRLALVAAVLLAPVATIALSMRHDRDFSEYYQPDGDYLSGRIIVRSGTGKVYCTGSVIHWNIVITAAHCVAGLQPSQVRFSFDGDEENGFEPDEIAVLSGYRPQQGEQAPRAGPRPPALSQGHLDWPRALSHQ